MGEKFAPKRGFTVATYNGLKVQYVAVTADEAKERACEDLVCEWADAERALEAVVVPILIMEVPTNA